MYKIAFTLLFALLLPLATAQTITGGSSSPKQPGTSTLREPRPVSGPNPKGSSSSTTTRPAKLPERKLDANGMRSDYPDPSKHKTPERKGAYPWKFNIMATYFYIGELASKNNPVHNKSSSWDSLWNANFGGYDDPDRSKRCPKNYIPLAFTPKLNPFYIALPYNDIYKGGPKPEAPRVIPWYHRDKGGKYESVCRGTWVQIYYNGRYCFAQWEDCGPFRTDDWEYVFGNARPKNSSNKAAGIDISPAVRDYLGIPGGMANVHWRFVEFYLVPDGPWARYGSDNPFINPELKKAIQKRQREQSKKTGSSTTTPKRTSKIR